ncbi:unnamed protein product [Vicia faba]|uniref:Uncharacterized protein n=1 Tax=Vicia faba TaxID=3906 RepID=A0AAV0ZE38_VICFA|nr:unnamed protein product [Vicia faba]
MIFMIRLILLALLLVYGAKCFARNTPKDVQNIEFEIDDYDKSGSNPKHNPHDSPSRLPLDIQNTQLQIDDYDKSGSNPKHNLRRPFHPPHDIQNIQFKIDDYDKSDSNFKYDLHHPLSHPPFVKSKMQ